MKKLIFALAVCVALGASAAVAKVRQIEHRSRPVQNSGTGVLPPGAQESMPKAARQIARDQVQGTALSPVLFSLFTPVQWAPADYDVAGLRLNLIYGRCCNFDGLDLGFVSVSDGHSNALAVDIVNYVRGDGCGLDVALANVFEGDYKGMQIGLANFNGSGDCWQTGVINRCYDGLGLQIGVINLAEHFEGLQIGVVNVINCSPVKFLPVLNWYF